MGGEIGFESGKDKGSIFWFTLPCRLNTVDDNSPAVSNGDSSPFLGKVLVIEDNKNLQLMIQKQLDDN